MSIQESGEMYLETILILSKEKEKVRAVDIAEHMNFSKAAISRALNRLRESGHIVDSDDSAVKLTDSGLQIAENIYKKHVLLTECIMQLGVDEETARADACKIEHDISDITFEAILHHAGLEL